MKTGITCLLIITILLPTIWSCGSREQQATAKNEITAETISVTREKVILTRAFPGHVEAKSQVVISSKISGEVTFLSVIEGNQVRKGAHLLTVDDRELKKKIESLRAARSQAEQSREAVAARVAYAEANFKRFSQLLKDNAATRDEYDRAKAAYESEAKQQHALAAQRKSITAQIEELQALLSYAVIESPVEGVVTKRFIDPGTFISAGQPLLAVDSPQQGFWFVAAVDEALITGIGTLRAVQVSVPSIGIERSVPPSVIVPQINPESRGFRVKIAIADPALRSGMYGHLYWPLGDTEKLLVPRQAVIQRGDLTAVFVVDSSRIIHFRLIKTGGYFRKRPEQDQSLFIRVESAPEPQTDNHTDTWVEVLSGLSASEVIIISNLHTISEGAVLK
jgi:multidrug efflux system membrane fusion protein